MTEAHEPNEIDGPHEGPIKTPKQLILAVFYAFVVPILIIVLLVMYVTSDERPGAGSDAKMPERIAERIRPIGVVEVKDLSDPAAMKTGEQVYAAQCGACHAAGTLGAPKLGDAEAWAPRLKQGFEALLQASLKGKGQMPPQGGGDHSDFEIARAVVHMGNQSGGKLAEPAMPVAAAASGSAVALASTAASAPAADANAGKPVEGLVAALNAQVKPTVPNAVPGNTPPATTTVAAAATGTPPPLYTQVCAVCHIAGVAGAPKLGDKAAWAPRIAQGIDALTASVIKGKGAMPPRGGSTASDAEIKGLVGYMVGASK